MKSFIKKTNGTNIIINFFLFLTGSSIAMTHLFIENEIIKWIPYFLGMSIIGVSGAFFNAEYDKDRIISGIHWKRTLIRGLIALGINTLSLMPWNTGYNFWLIIPSTCYTLSIFGIAFDIFLNFEKQKKWYYMGKEALYDRVLGKYSIAIEIIATVGCIWWFIRIL